MQQGLKWGGNLPKPITLPLFEELQSIEAREYQRIGAEFLFRKKRAMITDAPGLGKTPQAVLATNPPAIIIAPTYLVPQWGEWLATHLPSRTVSVARGDWTNKNDACLERSDFLVVNKEMLRTHTKTLLAVAQRYNTLIIDESHHLRNHKAKQSHYAVELAKKIKRVYLLTATPIWKEVDDLFMQLQILYPTIFPSYWDFVSTWCLADATRFGTKVYGIKKEMLPEMEQLLTQIRIGRTYKDAGRELPPVISNLVKIDFTKEQRRIYDRAVNGYRVKFANHPEIMLTSAIEVLHTLRQLTAFEKVEPIVETVSDAESYHDGQYIVFCWYKDFARQVAEALGATLITGDVKADERRKLALSGKPIVATISALSEGIDLSHMRMVIFAEEHWPPGSAVQAMMRVQRERQSGNNTEPILVYYTLVENSIDTHIHNVARRRSASIRELLTEALDLY